MARSSSAIALTDASPDTSWAGAPAATALATITVHHTAASVLCAWEELEAVAAASVYQTRAWLLPWLDTIGRKAEIDPMFILERDEAGVAQLLLPLGISRVGPLRVAGFLGGKDANFNMGLIRPSRALDRLSFSDLLRRAAVLAGARGPDFYRFVNQPLAWEGQPNPLAVLCTQPSPSFAYLATLEADAEAFFKRRLSKDTRKKLRKKESRLAEMGPIRHVVARDAATRDQVVTAFFAQKTVRFEEREIASAFDDPASQAFIRAASAEDRDGGIELHALMVGERIVATFGGGQHRGRFSGMFNSFDTDPDIARSSPGDLLLMKLIAAKSVEGATLDLGIGEARYKNTFCDEAVALGDSFLAITTKGRLFAGLSSLGLKAKRVIKQNPRFFALARRLRVVVKPRRGDRAAS